MAEVSTGGQSLDVVAKKDIKYLESLKKMSLEDANEVVSQRHDKRARSTKPIDQGSVNALYTNRMATNDTANTFTALLAAAQKK